MSQMTQMMRPSKPYPDYPLTPHPTGRWCKNIKGKLHYFGSWGKMVNGECERLPDDGWQAALDDYKSMMPVIAAGAELLSESVLNQMKFKVSQWVKCAHYFLIDKWMTGDSECIIEGVDFDDPRLRERDDAFFLLLIQSVAKVDGISYKRAKNKIERFVVKFQKYSKEIIRLDHRAEKNRIKALDGMCDSRKDITHPLHDITVSVLAVKLKVSSKSIITSIRDGELHLRYPKIKAIFNSTMIRGDSVAWFCWKKAPIRGDLTKKNVYGVQKCKVCNHPFVPSRPNQNTCPSPYPTSIHESPCRKAYLTQIRASKQKKVKESKKRDQFEAELRKDLLKGLSIKTRSREGERNEFNGTQS